MKKMLCIVFIFGFLLLSVAYSQVANNAYSAVIREAQSFVNGCGPDSLPRFSALLNNLSGSFTRSACNTHDIEYGTLGISRAEADNNLYNALGLASWAEAPGVATAFWSAVRLGGSSAYDSAQRRSREEFRRIHHGNEWSSSYGRWHPSNGHIRMSFPQCVQSCINLSR